MTEAGQSLSEIERQRAALGRRVRLPIWYLVLFGVGMAALMAAPVLGQGFGLGILGFGMQFLSMLVVCSPLLVQHRFTGVRLSDKPVRRYPSYRRAFGGYCAILLLGLGTVMVCTWHELYIPAMGIAGIAGVLAAFTIRYAYLSIGRDIAAGAAT